MTQSDNSEFSVLFNNDLQQKIKDKLLLKGLKHRTLKLVLLNLLLIAIVLFAYHNHEKFATNSMIMQSKKMLKKNVDIDLPNEILINNTANKKLETSLITADTITRNNITVRKIDTDSIVNIFQTASVNPEGFYVIVGAFKQFDNALKKQKTNPTDYSCYIIEDKSYLSKVGLFISENDKQAAFQALKKAKMMQQDSWLLYNHKK